MVRRRILAHVMLILVLIAATASAKLVSPYGDKNATVVEMNVVQTGNTTFSATLTLSQISQIFGGDSALGSAWTEGKIISPGTIAFPLQDKEVYFKLGEDSRKNYTDADGRVTFAFDIEQVPLDQNGCIEVYGEFKGDALLLASQGRREKICKNALVQLDAPLQEVTKKIQNTESMQNICIYFFVIIGFLLAGLYASGKDPLRLLDITTPRLPAARRKPELRISISEDKIKMLRKQQYERERELENAIKNTAREIAKNSDAVRNAANDSKRKQAEKQVYEKIMAKVEEKKALAQEKIKKSVKGIPLNRGIFIEFNLTYGMYADIANELVSAANKEITVKAKENETASRVRQKVKDMWGVEGEGLMLADKYVSERLVVDFASLVDRGVTGVSGTIKNIKALLPEKYHKSIDEFAEKIGAREGLFAERGTISPLRRKVESITGVGYVIRVVDDFRGWVKMAVDTPLRGVEYVRSGIGYHKAKKEVKTLQRDYLKEYKDFEKIQEEAKKLGYTVPIATRNAYEKKFADIQVKLDAAEKKLSKAEKKWAAAKEAGTLMPDLIKPAQESVIATTNLSKEIINDINNRLLKEFTKKSKEGITDKEVLKKIDKEMDRWRGKLVGGTRDVTKRHEEIRQRFHNNGWDLDYKNIMENVEEGLAINVQKYDEYKRDGFYKVLTAEDGKYYSRKYTLKEVYEIAKQNLTMVSDYDTASFIIGAGRAIGQDPLKYDAIIETQEQQLKRYLELDDFVREDVLIKAKEDGLKKAIKMMAQVEAFETPQKIRETHARYISDEEMFSSKPERYKKRIEDITREEMYFLAFSEAFLHMIDSFENEVIREITKKKAVLDPAMKNDFENVRRHYARQMAELQARMNEMAQTEGHEMTDTERKYRKEQIRQRIINSLRDIYHLEMKPEDYNEFSYKISIIMDKCETEATSQENLAKLSKDTTLVEKAVVEWSTTAALNRATGIMGRVLLKENITDLANKAEWENTCIKVTEDHGRMLNRDKRDRLVKINEEMGYIVEKDKAERMEAEELLLEMDRRWKDAMFPALLEFFKNVSKENEAYHDLYFEDKINGKEYIFVKAFQFPIIRDSKGNLDFSKVSKEETQNLVVIVNKELPHKKDELADIIAARCGISAAVAKRYIGFYDGLSNSAIVHVGAYLPGEALAKVPWIVESKGEYLACPKFMPNYETMGSADTMVNAGFAIDKKGRMIVSPIEDTLSRKVNTWLAARSNNFLQGAYIGIMAEARATTVMFTRHGGYLRKRVLGAFRGNTEFTKDVLRNERLADKLVEAYKLRYLLSRESEIDKKEFDKILAALLKPNKIKESISEELKRIKEEFEATKLGQELGLRDKYEKIGWDAVADEIRRIDKEMDDVATDVEKYDVLAKKREQLYQYMRVLIAKEAVDTAGDLRDIRSVDAVIDVCRPLVGEFVMQENLLDLLSKSRLRKEEFKQELEFTKKEILYIEKISKAAFVKSLKDELKGIMLPPDTEKEIDDLLNRILDEIEASKDPTKETKKNLELIDKAIDEIVGKLESAHNRILAALPALENIIINKATLEGKYGPQIAAAVSTKELKEVAAAIIADPEISAALNAAKNVSHKLSKMRKIEDRISSATTKEKLQSAFNDMFEAAFIDAGTVVVPGVTVNAAIIRARYDNKINSAATPQDFLALAKEILMDSDIKASLSSLPTDVQEKIVKRLMSAGNAAEFTQAFQHLINCRVGVGALHDESEKILHSAKLIKIGMKTKISDYITRYNAMHEKEDKLSASIFMESLLEPVGRGMAKHKMFWNLTLSKIGKDLSIKLMQLGKFRIAKWKGKTSGKVWNSYNIIDEIQWYSDKVKEIASERTEFERLMIAHLRNSAYISEKFLTRAYAMYKTFNESAHTRLKSYGLNYSGQAGYQFAGPLPSTLMQQIVTYGRHGNSGWFISMMLAHPIRKVQKIYSQRYPVTRLMIGVPAVYDPMKSAGGIFGDTMHSIKAMMYMKFKDKLAKFGEVIRTTAKESSPPVFAPYLLSRNPYGEVRIAELIELFSDNFRTTARGPRDCLNYLLYEPNDIVIDFQDILFTIKESRSMKKTPEHLMDVGIYGVVANSGFIAGREINFIQTALGGPESMYPNRGWGMMHYNPQLTIPTMRYSGYADFYKRTMKPTEVATEIVRMTEFAEEVRWQPFLPMVAMYFLPLFSSPALAAAIGFGGMGMYKYRNKMRYAAARAVNYISKPPWRSDTWKTYETFSERLRNMYRGMYGTGGTP